MPEQLFTLSSAEISLFLIDGAGAVVEPAVWTGVKAEGVRMAYSFDTIKTRPTGRPFPRTRIINEEHQIEIDRVWVINDGDFQMDRDAQFILKIEWTDPANRSPYSIAGSHSRTYYGVNTVKADLAANDQHQFKQSQSFVAEYFVEETVDGPDNGSSPGVVMYQSN